MKHSLTRRLAPLAALSALALVVAGCSSGNANASTPASSKPSSGGNVTIAIGSDLGCIDPQQIGNNDDIAIARQTVASLTWQDPANGKIEPWLASSWQINATATGFTFDLRSGATFADGTPIPSFFVFGCVFGG